MGLVDAGDTKAAAWTTCRRLQPSQVVRPGGPPADAGARRLAPFASAAAAPSDAGVERPACARESWGDVHRAFRLDDGWLSGLRVERLSRQILRRRAAVVGGEQAGVEGAREHRAPLGFLGAACFGHAARHRHSEARARRPQLRAREDGASHPAAHRLKRKLAGARGARYVFSSSATTSLWCASRAMSSAVLPRLSLRPGFAPAASSALTVSALPLPAAPIKAVRSLGSTELGSSPRARQ